MKVIFLDFDGVLNTENHLAHLRSEELPVMDSFGHLFDPEAVGNLRSILDAVPDAKIVIESSWKLMGLPYIKRMWKTRNLPGEISDATPDISDNGLLDIDLSAPGAISRLEGMGKGGEISSWLHSHTDKECRYVILDDVGEFFGEPARHHIAIHPDVGITKEDAQKAIELLNG